jgi:hypothetical protein
MAEYDGWTIKNVSVRHPFFCIGYFRPTKKEVIELFDKNWNEKGAWKREIRKGRFIFVKVKFVEVE